MSPDWSPDGTQIVFTRLDLSPEVWIVNTDGTNVRQLTHAQTFDVTPAWSPDGTQIVFSRENERISDIELGKHGLWVVNADGTNLRQLTEGKATSDLSPSWSPDGTQIMFTRQPEPFQRYRLWTINPDGTNAQKLHQTGYLLDISSQAWTLNTVHHIRGSSTFGDVPLGIGRIRP